MCLATALALMGVAATPAWAQREVPTRTTQVQFKRGAALPPEISHMTVWSPITPERKLDDEEAIYRGANHWLPA